MVLVKTPSGFKKVPSGTDITGYGRGGGSSGRTLEQLKAHQEGQSKIAEAKKFIAEGGDPYSSGAIAQTQQTQQAQQFRIQKAESIQKAQAQQQLIISQSIARPPLDETSQNYGVRNIPPQKIYTEPTIEERQIGTVKHPTKNYNIPVKATYFIEPPTYGSGGGKVKETRIFPTIEGTTSTYNIPGYKPIKIYKELEIIPLTKPQKIAQDLGVLPLYEEIKEGGSKGYSRVNISLQEVTTEPLGNVIGDISESIGGPSSFEEARINIARSSKIVNKKFGGLGTLGGIISYGGLEIARDIRYNPTKQLALVGLGYGVGYGLRFTGATSTILGARATSYGSKHTSLVGRNLLKVGPSIPKYTGMTIQSAELGVGSYFTYEVGKNIYSVRGSPEELGKVIGITGKDVLLFGVGGVYGKRGAEVTIGNIRTKNLPTERVALQKGEVIPPIIRGGQELYFTRGQGGKFTGIKYDIVAPEYYAGQKYPLIKGGTTIGKFKGEFYQGSLTGEFGIKKTYPYGYSGRSLPLDNIIPPSRPIVSELTGLYSAPRLNPTFLRLGVSNKYGFGLTADVTGIPTIIRTRFVDFKIPEGVSPNIIYGKANINAMKLTAKYKKTGTTLLAGEKTEKQVVTILGSRINPLSKVTEFTTIEGIKLPIERRVTSPSTSLTGKENVLSIPEVQYSSAYNYVPSNTITLKSLTVVDTSKPTSYFNYKSVSPTVSTPSYSSITSSVSSVKSKPSYFGSGPSGSSSSVSLLSYSSPSSSSVSLPSYFSTSSTSRSGSSLISSYKKSSSSSRGYSYSFGKVPTPYKLKFKSSRGIPRYTKGYTVLGRRFGKFKPVGISKTEGGAFGLGTDWARKTLGATFKVPQAKARKLTGFKTKKEKGEVFYVEPRKRRLKKGGKETLEIQFYKSIKGGKK